MEQINYVLGYKNLKIYQDTEMFKFSLDSVLLANFVKINKKHKKLLDIGTGNAIIPLIISSKYEIEIDAVEIQKEVYDLAIKSVKLNNKNINVINADINQYYKTVETEKYDIIVSNPPYFKNNGKSLKNQNKNKSTARHEESLSLEQLFKISKKLLKNNGSLYIVNRPERLSEIICLMHLNNIEPKVIKFVYPKIDKDANIVLIRGTKNGKPGLKIEYPLITHNKNNTYTKKTRKYFS